jgi:hypothetical protein
MRAFWAILALLAAVGLWFVFVPTFVTTFVTTRPTNSNASPDRDDSRHTTPADASDTPEATNDVHAKNETSSNVDAGSDRATTTTTDHNAPAPIPNESASSAQMPILDLFGGAAQADTATTTSTPSSTTTPTTPAKRAVRVDTRNPSDVVRRIDERTVELDGRYRVTGNGSANDPYVISWELLTSASEFIDLAQNARTPPPWVRLLDGTYVQISGYYSTAVRVSVAKNLLLTLNRWDGCCIGVPPTPFDAIDIDMRAPLPMGGLHLIRFGTFRGQLRVETVEAASYLLGFYRLEDATFETK